VHIRSHSRRRAEPTATAVPRITTATRLACQRPVRPDRRTATTACHAPPGGPPTLDRRGRAALGTAPAAGPVAEHVGIGRNGANRDGPGHTGRRAHRVHRTAPASPAPPSPTPSASPSPPTPPPASSERDAGATAAAVAATAAPESYGWPSLGHDGRGCRLGVTQSAAPPPSSATTATATATRSRALVAPAATAPAAPAAPTPATAHSSATATGKRFKTSPIAFSMKYNPHLHWLNGAMCPLTPTITVPTPKKKKNILKLI